MTAARLEHINITVNDSRATAAALCDLFDWKIRWEGSAMNGIGYTCHVGTDDDYLAVYSPGNGVKRQQERDYETGAAMNHVGLIVDDLDAMEGRVKAAGYSTRLHADYEPGRRFYFDGPDGIEFELVSYE
ncbi:VOC family protein [Pseudahrensia aquimaris]|uniref:VOC family protein n=1 Tax=Pseudahrensia aquimaris TaxID=744461 RepID=A0ABW3F8Y9_9HYPH